MEKNTQNTTEQLLASLTERAKELNCLYRVQESLRNFERPIEEIGQEIVEAIPPAWQFPEFCMALLMLDGQEWVSKDFTETPWLLCAPIMVQERVHGRLCVYYRNPMPAGESGPFLKEEIKLIEAVADQIAHFMHHRHLRMAFERQRTKASNGSDRPEWEVVLELLRMTDPQLADRISRKMMNYLCFSGIVEAGALVQRSGGDQQGDSFEGEVNQPRQKTTRDTLYRLGQETFELAARFMSNEEILGRLKKWIAEDRSNELVNPLINGRSTLTEVVEALQRYRERSDDRMELSETSANGVRVALVRRFFTEHLETLSVFKKYVDIEDFCEVTDRVIYPRSSHGKVGGKGTGLFVARNILKRTAPQVEAIGEVRVPKTWYVTSDTVVDFLAYNNLEEVYEQKYKSVEEVRQEYPHIVQLFKNSHFPQDLQTGLLRALDDFGDVPLVVRSSSLLEDRLSSAFSGKYKSLFLANQGDRKQRLEALQDAIAEVYASTFGPDPIEYRAERGLLDFNEEMGVLIQEVVGTRVGRYWLPAWAGVAFSNNEFRWSPRIRREDGLLRIVPGLGTRAVDRLTDDYPILIAPGQPNLRVNVSIDEVIRYSPKQIDVIDLEENCFVSMKLPDLVQKIGTDYPAFAQVFSLYKDGMMRRLSGMMASFDAGLPVVTFDGLVASSGFVKKLSAILKALQDALGTPVDIEFASDGKDFYLLQCRPQSHSKDVEAVEIPSHVPRSETLFTANRYVSNGRVPDISHVVYVDPERYAAISNLQDLMNVGRAVGRLNNLLPKRQFILIGPGRWGSRGDIQLGVRVTYSDINNTAMLVEVARKKGNYVPDLSFGTHFFQDLVEASIRYLPLYPDDNEVFFNDQFLLDAPNILPSVLPDMADLQDILRVIDLPAALGGRMLRILMNAERDQALAYFTDASIPARIISETRDAGAGKADDHWRWRLGMAERIGSSLDPRQFGVVAFYVMGSTKNASAGPGSDIDLLVHVRNNPVQARELEIWFDAWSRALSEMNYLRTGYRSEGLLDVHYVTDQDIERRTSWAIKIGAVTDPARRLPMASVR